MSTPAEPPTVSAPIPAASARGTGSGAYIRELLSQGVDQHEIVRLVHERFPQSKATIKDVAYHKYKLKKIAALPAAAQPLRTGPRLSNDETRSFDRSSLRANSHGQWVHRDYGAHFFRWGFAGRFVDGETDVLDVGCGPDCAFISALTMPRNQVPRSYVGVDLNREPRNHPTRQWATLRWEFDFLERHGELGQFDLVTNFEVIEHMYQPDGERLLAGLRSCLRPTGKLLLSTPVFNGKAAANHLHEWEVEELKTAIAAAGLRVERRFGTFASANDLKRAADPAHLAVTEALSAYYSGEVLACFLAPLYPDASRNNLWVLRRDDAQSV